MNDINPSIAGISCIVVDDDFYTTEVFSEWLSIKGFNVVGKAYDAETAIKMFDYMRPDIVFLDVMMQPKSGCYALEKIRRIDPNAIVIMVTADIRKTTSCVLEKLQTSAIIFKPFDIQQVTEAVSKLVMSQALRKNSIR